MNNNDVILYENNVVVDSLGNVKLTITDKNIIFEKEKGIFRKRLKTINTISIDKIRLYKDKAYIKQKKNVITINTVKNEVIITFKNFIEAKKVCSMINNLRTGNNVVDRSVKKVGNAVKNIGKVANVTIDVVETGKEIYEHINGDK